MRHVLVNGRVLLGNTDGVFAQTGTLLSGSRHVVVGSWNRGGRDRQKSTIALFSQYAYQRFVDLSRRLEREEFILWVMGLFREAATLESADRLYRELRDGTFKNPEIRVLAIRHRWSGSYHIGDGLIEVSAALALDAAKFRTASAHLICVLLEEFGHHVEAKLRKYAGRTAGYRPGRDYGAQFGAELSDFDCGDRSVTYYARLESPEGSFDLSVEHAALAEAVRTFIPPEEIWNDGRDAARAYFGTPGHASVVRMATSSILGSPEAVKKVHFGDWLRDMSQVVSPTLLSITGLPRAKLTKIVDILARLEFGDDFAVTEDLLGMYQPEEHIDNVWGWNNGGYAGFRRNGTTDDISLIDAAIPKQTRKKYMSESEEFVRNTLYYAANTAQGDMALIHLGAALHVIEDLYAHSNLIENTIFDMLPDAKRVALVKPQDGGGLPIVGPLRTGTFGYIDVTVSLLGMIAEKIREGGTHIPNKSEKSKADFAKARAAVDLIEVVLSALNEKLASSWRKWAGRALHGAESATQTLEELDKVAATVDTAMEYVVPGYKVAKTVGKQLTEYIQKVVNYVEIIIRRWQVKVLNLIRTQLATIQSPTLNHGELSHAQIAKDDEKSPLYHVALELAFHSSQRATELVVAQWDQQQWSTRRTSGSDSIEQFVADTFMNRVLLGSSKEVVDTWVKSNPTNINRVIWIYGDARGMHLAELVSNVDHALRRLCGKAVEVAKLVDKQLVSWWNEMVALWQRLEREVATKLDIASEAAR